MQPTRLVRPVRDLFFAVRRVVSVTPGESRCDNTTAQLRALGKRDRRHRGEGPGPTRRPKAALLFIGSSTIRGWKTLAQDFPDHKVINRGFGGSQIVDSTHFADRLIFPHEPKMILLRAGGNDIHAGKSAEQVFRDFQDFVAKVHSKLPETDIVFIGLSPAPALDRA